ncbi:Uncharacterised protein [Mesomycoplasma conjunctivae]|uniref:Uncharacterized protein n=1 Tax=Mesomycoplasma conjunctivae (strain ATCC 25834 / NCTC 10147 / HRC/581) TaxID=572263 RepID=C5J6J1_MESCH|nr:HYPOTHETICAL PROTEIN MCJ_003950 [Mesomycoplasma conjunctivae]VEU66260.1 Uncharacterised protein [Mesomycoplasma conjunctivae]
MWIKKTKQIKETIQLFDKFLKNTFKKWLTKIFINFEQQIIKLIFTNNYQKILNKLDNKNRNRSLSFFDIKWHLYKIINYS